MIDSLNLKWGTPAFATGIPHPCIETSIPMTEISIELDTPHLTTPNISWFKSKAVQGIHKQDVAIILNGPPGCGKDTIAKALCGIPYHNVCAVNRGFDPNWCVLGNLCGGCRYYTSLMQREFKHSLYRETANYFGVHLDYLMSRATDRDLKELPAILLDGLTPRQALIHVSEHIMKPMYGPDYFGRQEAAEVVRIRHEEMPHFDAIYSDGGFIEEVAPLVNVFQHICIIRLHREGYSFANDSRTHLYPIAMSGIHSCDVILEDGKEAEAVSEVISIYKELKTKCN